MLGSNILKIKKCCCMSLRTGCLVVGYLETVGNGLGLFNSLYGFDKEEDDIIDVIINVSIASSLFILNAAMLWGVHKERKYPILPWLIVKFFGYVAITIFCGIKLVELVPLMITLDNHKFHLIFAVITGVISILLFMAWYSFACIYSYYTTEIKNVEKVKEKQN